MQIAFTLELWHAILSFGSVFAFLFGMAKYFFNGLDKSIKEINAHVDLRLNEADIKQSKIERELLELKAEIPKEYVRRDDFIRATATIEAKLDANALRLQNAVLNRGKN